jgi:hypothetical protein
LLQYLAVCYPLFHACYSNVTDVLSSPPRLLSIYPKFHACYISRNHKAIFICSVFNFAGDRCSYSAILRLAVQRKIRNTWNIRHWRVGHNQRQLGLRNDSW